MPLHHLITTTIFHPPLTYLKGVSEVDPSNKVIVEDDELYGYEIDMGNKGKQKNIPLDNHIITNEDGGKTFIKSRKVEPPKKSEKIEKPRKEVKGKVQGIHYIQTTVVNPFTCQ